MNHKVYDIHAHIAPAIDDGAVDLDMSMEMLKMAHSQGTRAIVCTSHIGFDVDEYCKNIHVLQSEITNNDLDINVFEGCEIYCNFKCMHKIISWLNNKLVPTINKTKYVLVEFDPWESLENIALCVSTLNLNRYKVIIAHVERYNNLFDGNKLAAAAQEMHCLIQVNAYSLVDERNEHIKARARKMLEDKYISFIGSDAHRTDHRTYLVEHGVEYIYNNCDINYADDICYKNAERILNMY